MKIHLFWMCVLGSALMVTSCANPENTEVMTEAPFSDTTVCMEQWTKLFNEWKRNGGGLKESIAATRNQIESDQHSRFAEVIRSLWTAQDSRESENISYGPLREINSNDSRKISAILIDLKTDHLDKDCKLQMYPYAIFSQEIFAPSKNSPVRPREVPTTMEWASPSAQHWMAYWIFVRDQASNAPQ